MNVVFSVTRITENNTGNFAGEDPFVSETRFKAHARQDVFGNVLRRCFALCRRQISIPSLMEERAVFIVSGAVEFLSDAGEFTAGQLVVFKPGAEIVLTAAANSKPARLMLLGGEPLGQRRHIWRNFVSSSKERIEQAKLDWKEGRFALIPDETEFIPLQADSRPIVIPRYP